MKKSKFISLILILLNLFILSSCINSEVDLKREKITNEIYSFEREQECMIITNRGCYSKEIEFIYENEINDKFFKDNIIPFDNLVVNAVYYYEGNIFLLCYDYENSDRFFLGKIDSSVFSIQYVCFEGEIRNYGLLMSSYYFDNTYAIFLLHDVGNRRNKYLLYNYIDNIYEIKETKEDLLNSIGKEEIEEIKIRGNISGPEYLYNDKVYYVYASNSDRMDYNYGKVVITDKDSFRQEINYSFILENNQIMKKIDEILGEDKINMKFHFYIQENDLFISFYDQGKDYSFIPTYLKPVVFKYDIDTMKLTYMGSIKSYDDIIYIKYL